MQQLGYLHDHHEDGRMAQAPGMQTEKRTPPQNNARILPASRGSKQSPFLVRRHARTAVLLWTSAVMPPVAVPWLLMSAGTVSSAALVDTTIYGGAFDSASTVAHAEVVQTCFAGLEVGSCEASSPNWLKDFLDQYNQGTTGTYCASCCSNSDSSGDLWTFDCELVSSAFVDFVNHFGWEFRFGRRQSATDKAVVTCPIPRTACSYDEQGALSGACESDGSFLAAYVLTVEVMTVESGMKSWKSVQGCSVHVDETSEEPSSLRETLKMTQEIIYV